MDAVLSTIKRTPPAFVRMVPRAVVGRFVSTKAKMEDEHFEDHWTYPYSYPTEEEMHRRKQEREAYRRQVREMHFEEHWTYPYSYPTKEEIDRQHVVQEEISHLRHERAAQNLGIDNERWVYPMTYPTPEQLEVLAKAKKETKEQKKKEEEIRHHMWE